MRRNPELAVFTDWLESVDTRLARLEDAPVAAPAPATPLDDADVSIADIRAAYRLLLDREPDATGLARYGSQSPGLTRSELVEELLGSDERVALEASRIVVLKVGDVSIVVDRTERDFGRHLSETSIWEPHILHHIGAALSPGAVFVDIGANVGVMSFHAAKIVGPTGAVIAFEPNPDNGQRFLQGLVLNELANVRFYPLAASADTSVFSLKGSSNTALVAAHVGARLVPSVAADTILQSEPKIDLIKIDVEGHEPKVMAGLKDTLDRHSPLILCEFNPRCLRVARHVTPVQFAESLFERARHISVIEQDCDLTTIATAHDLMALWKERNALHVAKGDLPNGMLHFDLLIRNR